VADLMGWEKFPAAWSLGITFAILGAGVAVSLWKTRGGDHDGHGGKAVLAE
jgi:tellurite resistance protein TerC